MSPLWIVFALAATSGSSLAQKKRAVLILLSKKRASGLSLASATSA
jgi:hypothetical protein